jgi:hypothetical protein
MISASLKSYKVLEIPRCQDQEYTFLLSWKNLARRYNIGVKFKDWFIGWAYECLDLNWDP